MNKLDMYEVIEIYCDGAIKGIRKKKQHCGIGIIPIGDLFENTSISLCDYGLTNNKIEIMGVLLSVLFVIDNYKGNKKLNINIKTDSEYTVKAFNEYMEKWQNNGWKNSTGAEVKNKQWCLLIFKNIK